MASIQHRTAKDGSQTWRVGYYQAGKLRWTRGFGDPEGAVIAKGLIESQGPELALLILDRRNGDGSSGKAPTLAAWFDRHLELLGSHATEGTIADYRRIAGRSWMIRLGQMPIDSITHEDVIEWVTWQRSRETLKSQQARARARRRGEDEPAPLTWSPKAIANCHGLLSSVFASAIDAKHITSNPAEKVRLPSDQERREPRFLTPAEFTTLVDALPDYWRPIVVTMAGMGVRFGEVTGLRVRDIDLDSRMMSITSAWKKGATTPVRGAPKSKKSRRKIAMPQTVVDVIAPLLDGKGSDDLVFTTVNGTRVRSGDFSDRVWQPAIAKAGLTPAPRPHDLRHSHASWLLADGVPLIVVQRRLGHESIATTEGIYGHLLPDAQTRAVQATEAAISAAMPQLIGPA